jgi:hypothetical protein
MLAGRDPDRVPRICMPTSRRFKRVVFQSALYEAQDVFAAVDDVDLIELEATSRFVYQQPIQRKLLWHDRTRTLALCNPGLRPVRLKRRYDLLVLVCQNWWDLLNLNAIQGWKDAARESLCYIDELWAGDVDEYRYWLPALARFDHVVVNMRGSMAALERAIEKRCYHVPFGIDALRFTPYPCPPARTIDVYSIGRRWPAVHEVLLRLAREKQAHYVYDAMVGVADMETSDHCSYRELLANMARRSRYFIVGPAKLGVPEETRGQQELGYRFFEGSAAGAVLVGQSPDCDSFRALFDWPDAVINVRPDGADTTAVLAALEAEPERLRAISRRNALEVLRRHDWVYRWRDILAVAGLKPLPQADARIRRLRALAETAHVGAQAAA